MMTKEKIELSFIFLLLNFRRIKEGQLRKKAQEVAGKVADGAKGSLVKGSQ